MSAFSFNLCRGRKGRKQDWGRGDTDESKKEMRKEMHDRNLWKNRRQSVKHFHLKLIEENQTSYTSCSIWRENREKMTWEMKRTTQEPSPAAEEMAWRWWRRWQWSSSWCRERENFAIETRGRWSGSLISLYLLPSPTTTSNSDLSKLSSDRESELKWGKRAKNKSQSQVLSFPVISLLLIILIWFFLGFSPHQNPLSYEK